MFIGNLNLFEDLGYYQYPRKVQNASVNALISGMGNVCANTIATVLVGAGNTDDMTCIAELKAAAGGLLMLWGV
ncbi:hypothetical protein BDW66DRAFT_137138 [Aspergillus desertorum]